MMLFAGLVDHEPAASRMPITIKEQGLRIERRPTTIDHAH